MPGLAQLALPWLPPPVRADGPAAAPAPLPGGRRVVVASLPAAHALSRQQGPTRRWFDWSANPYRGCEVGCGYCYARGTHVWLGHEDPRDFQDRLYVKDGFVEALRRDLRRRVRPGEHVAFGTATDPYQPIEAREGVMRAALRELSGVSGLRVSVTTKSALVARDADLLAAVGRRNRVQVNVSVTTPDARLARFLEPRAPTPQVRIETLRTLTRSGVRAGLFLMPVLPGVTDAEVDLRALLTQAADAGARYVVHQVVFLEGPAHRHFLAVLRRAYPRVAARYEVWTRCGRNLPSDLRRETAERVRAAARAAGLDDSAGSEPPRPAGETQQRFPFAAAGGAA